jgi:superfamily II DNA or RNA helicase
MRSVPWSTSGSWCPRSCGHVKSTLQKTKENFEQDTARQTGTIVLPTGCGKSGIIILLPYALTTPHVLIITPHSAIRGQLYNDLCGYEEAKGPSENRLTFVHTMNLLPPLSLPSVVTVKEGVQITKQLANHHNIVIANASMFSRSANSPTRRRESRRLPSVNTGRSC